MMTNDDNQLLTFPCEFPIKVFGQNDPAFVNTITEIIERYVAAERILKVKDRLSSGNKFLAITITIQATSQQELDQIYQDLTDCNLVKMAL